MTMTRTEQKKELMEVLQDVPVKMTERFKRDFERMAFDTDAEFYDWIDEVCLEVDHANCGKNGFQSMISKAMSERIKHQQEYVGTVIYGFDGKECKEQRIRGLK